MKKFTILTMALCVLFLRAHAEKINVDYLQEGSTTTIHDGDVLTGHTEKVLKIEIEKNASITLDGLWLNKSRTAIGDVSYAGLSPKGTVHIYLKGENYVCGFGMYEPGIFVPNNSTVHIYSAQEGASLDVRGCVYGGAGIGTGNEYNTSGHIRIHSGIVKAYGGEGSAGLGGGRLCGLTGTIMIEGGTITAKGGEYAAGIGTGFNSRGGAITISGGSVTATGGTQAPGIGAGMTNAEISRCGNISISGVNYIKSQAGSNAPYCIGAGVGALCGTITVMGTTYTNGVSGSVYEYPEPCYTPMSLHTTAVGPHSFTVAWTKGADTQKKFEVEYYEKGTSQKYTQTVTSTSCTISGLNEDRALYQRTYTVHVRAICSTNYYSDYTADIEVTTQSVQAIDEVSSEVSDTHKIIRDGQILIQKGDKLFDMLGNEIK